jgi:hypothetical protein
MKNQEAMDGGLCIRAGTPLRRVSWETFSEPWVSRASTGGEFASRWRRGGSSRSVATRRVRISSANHGKSLYMDRENSGRHFFPDKMVEQDIILHYIYYYILYINVISS